MPALNDYDGEGVLTVNGLVLNCPGWSACGDERGQGGLLRLLFAISKRGEDRLIPGAAGVIPYPRRRTGFPLDTRLVVTGDVDGNGTPHSDSAEGLLTNLETIYDGIIEPSSGPDPDSGTVIATYVGLGFNVTTNLHVIGMEMDEYQLGRHNGVSHGSLWQGVISFSLPTGRLT